MVQRFVLILFMISAPDVLFAENGYRAWLRYAALDDLTAAKYREVIPAVIATVGTQGPVQNARQELRDGISGMLGRNLRQESRLPNESAIVIGTIDELRKIAPQLALTANLTPDAYWLKSSRLNGFVYTVVTGANDRAVLYGSFALLRKIAVGDPVIDLDEKQTPFAAVRWLNHWDNIDGTIERGYGGSSIFWENGHLRESLDRVRDYGRLLASLGINGISINNVNANTRFLEPELLAQVARVADALRPWGVRVALSIDFSSPMKLGGLATFDPLDSAVIAWWKSKVDEIYRAVPDLGGLVLKADSEGRLGPSAFGRTHADAANVIARALKPHGGLFFYRGFVYDNKMDWRNLKNDRARAADDNFRTLDGKFDDNVIIQVKNGPIDFQVREPASPLFGTLEKTHSAIELQITQEYMGQARHTVFLVPMWKEALDFDLRARDARTPVKSRVTAFVGVSNVGTSDSWFGNHMSQANLYGFGRLAWNPDLSSRQIAEEWTRQTFGTDPAEVAAITEMQLTSWRTYENYTGPLGLQTLTDIVGNHYGVAVEASERNGWGQWHRADERGVGMDRTVATGTGFIGQFSPAVAKEFESLATCPDDLVLFMHHVPYTHVLHSGKTVIQYIYDSHYEGAEAVASYVRAWRALKGRVDDGRYEEVLAQLRYQAAQSIVWRDAVSNWFHRTSGVPDARGRVGRHPGRIEAESMNLTGYKAVGVTPWEAASGDQAIECGEAACAAGFRYDGEPGWRDIAVQYFDVNNGVARFRVSVAGQVLSEWQADDRLPTRRVDSSSSTRRVIAGVALRPGDEIRIEGFPDGGETAALDYVEITMAEN